MSLKMSTTGGQHSFARIPKAEIQRSVFNRSHGHKTTFSSGWLIPIFVDEALPGDTWNLRMHAFGRLATLMRPIMDNLYLDVFFFAVPNRLLWVNWERFNGSQDNPGDSTDFLLPQINFSTGGTDGSLSDYFGIPPAITGLNVNALPFRAYYKIYNEWFRDENLCPSVSNYNGDGPSDVGSYTLLKRGKRHDYFTSALPWPQKGTAVSLPLGASAPVTGNPVFTFSSGGPSLLSSGSTPAQTDWDTPPAASIPTTGVTGLTADLGQAVAATVNNLREAFQIQRLLERDARGGTRYTEILRSHFGVVSPDARLQRPEYLGGGTVRINVNPVASSFRSDQSGFENALGDLGGIGTFGHNAVGFRQSFTEHCVVMGLMCLRADLNYQQGIERMWSRRTRFDFFWPALAHLGEQAILNKEIYAQGTVVDDQVFGYQERYAEYRYKPSYVTARMRSSSAASLDSWHLSQDFSALPVLNQSFIEENPPIDRVIAVTSQLEPQAICDMFFDYKCARPMPVFGVPGMIDHF